MDFNDFVMLLVSVFQLFLHSLMTDLTVWCACRAFFLTEETDAPGVNRYTGHVSFESVTLAHYIK